MNNIKVGAAYLRVSTDDQVEYSPDSQLKLIRDYAKRDGYMIPDEYVYRDDGISGKSANKRPAFRLMIATAKEEKKPFDTIFVWKYSRFARNQEEAIMYKNLLHKKGVEVKSISEPSNDSPFSSLIERIIEWMDEYYLINLASEVRRGKTEKASRGEYSGRPPYGYSIINKQLIPNDSADIVRYIFERYVAGDTVRDIAMKAAEIGARTVTGKMPDNRFVHYIIQNSAYIGKVRYSPEGRMDYLYGTKKSNDLIEVTGKHEPIIDMRTWELAQERFNRRGHEVKYVRPENPDGYMLKGLLRCSSCGATLVRGNRYADDFSLQCNGYSKGKCTVSHYIHEKQANEIVISGLEECLKNNTYTFVPKKEPKTDTAQRDWDKLITSEENKLKRARRALLDGVFTDDEYKETKAEVDEIIKKLRQTKENDNSNQPSIDQKAMQEKTVELIKILKSPDVSAKAKNEALRSVLQKIVFNKSENTFDLYFLP